MPDETPDSNQPDNLSVQNSINAELNKPAEPLVQPVVLGDKPKKNKSISILIAIFVTMLVSGGLAFAFNFWYQNPQKVITDSIINAITAKTSIYTGTIKYDDSGSGAKINVDITAKQADVAGNLSAKLTMTLNGKDYVVTGDALLDKVGDLYFKVSELIDIASEAIADLGIVADSPTDKAIDNLVDKIDGVWVKISSDDLKQFGDSYAVAKTCINSTTKQFQGNKAALAEVTDLYKKHQFITVEEKLKQQNDNLGYKIEANPTEAKAFSDGMKNTQIYKALYNCDNNLNLNIISTDSATATEINGSLTLWINQWTHQITKIEVNNTTGTATTLVSIDSKYNQTLDIATPTSSITLSDLTSYITKIVQSLNLSV